jgi:flagellar motor component MotA
MKEQPEHSLLLRWLILTGLIIFSAIIAWNQGVISLLFSIDQSRISLIIALVYLLVTLHCAKLIYSISLQMNLSRKVDRMIKDEDKLDIKVDGDDVFINSTIKLPDCFMSDYISDLFYSNKNKKNAEEAGSPSELIEVYESRLKGPQEIGWFVSDMMLKLGLLGTIIGFILMLGSVANIANFDVSDMQKILQHMSNGMGTALYTTLAGLVCSILSALQYHMIDRHVDELIELTRHLTQVHVLPKINRA